MQIYVGKPQLQLLLHVLIQIFSLNFLPGKEADFVILDKQATPFLDFRFRHCNTLLEELFVLATLGDDRNVLATYAAGKAIHHRDKTNEAMA